MRRFFQWVALYYDLVLYKVRNPHDVIGNKAHCARIDRKYERLMGAEP